MEYCQEQGLEYVVETPRIVMQLDLERIRSKLDRLGSYAWQAVMVNDLGSWQEGRSRGYTLYGGAGLNICNSQAGQLIAHQGLSRFTASGETSFTDLLALLDADLLVDVVVHGPQCALITDFCLIKAAVGDTQRPCPVLCQDGKAFLRDELGQHYEIRSDEQCRNHIFLPKQLSLYNFLPILTKANANGLRLEGQYTSARELYEVVSIYQEGLQQLSSGQWSPKPYERLLRQYPQAVTPGWVTGRDSF